MIPKYFAVRSNGNEDFWKWFSSHYNTERYNGSGTFSYYGISKQCVVLYNTKDSPRWHEDTVFFESAEEFMALVDAKPLRDIKYLKKREAIHCPTKQDADSIINLLVQAGRPSFISNYYYDAYGTETIICISRIDEQSISYGSVGWAKNNDYTIFPASDFLTTNTKQEEMKTQTISYAGMQEIYTIACESWKKKLIGWTKPFVDTELNEAQINEMYAAATSAQKSVLDKYFQQEPTIKEMAKVANMGIFPKTEGAGEVVMIDIREFGNFKNKAFYLNPKFNWKIAKDESGIDVLIPTPKNKA